MKVLLSIQTLTLTITMKVFNIILSIQTTLVLPIMMKVLFFVNESVIIHSNTDTNDYDESVLHNIIH